MVPSSLAESPLDPVGSLMSSIEVWGIFTLILLLIATLFTPFSMIFLSRSKHQATIQRLTPDYERPPGH